MEGVSQLKEWMKASNNIVFFGGAGVSTESDIPDFRGVDGLYQEQYKYPPETIISHSFYRKNPKEFYRFYCNKMIFPQAKPNKAHHALKKLEDMGKLKAVITQNIDGLHQAAGSVEVLELHGSVKRNYCTKCMKFYNLKEMLASMDENEVPRCDCKGLIKPDVVLYEESLNESVMSKAVSYISNADMLIIGGTSLTVYPAAGLIDYYRGDRMVLINKTVTPLDDRADLVISGSIGQVLHDSV
ncbi:NAD-dependent protein deacylase [Lacrimispora algidixylanolytica]|uniref:NAD-dependent protein deacetylase n=1 Tax=Lacrimispora algidixylanolytica TaxID=94868 RepID=A0A419T929_9FIRM|nr:NAD-dependent protein deacylase [Lacrimispora algidixylanolytica]RKD33978.1 NAD-dependent protein deacylase [Lacrimispora algidixylanolytica]